MNKTVKQYEEEIRRKCKHCNYGRVLDVSFPSNLKGATDMAVGTLGEICQCCKGEWKNCKECNK